ncbi:hypothetical protein D3C81_2015020 [compost metagenome]
MERLVGKGNPSLDAFGHHTRNMLQNGYADRSSNQIRFSNCRRHFFSMGNTAQCGYVLYHYRFLTVAGQCHRIFPAFLKLGHKGFIHIDEADLVACL